MSEANNKVLQLAAGSYKRTGERSVTFGGEEEQRSEREVIFKIKIAASDT